MSIDITDPDYSFLSNDSYHGFREEEHDIWWPTATHYIEGKKFAGTEYEVTVRSAKTPYQAKRLARERTVLELVADSDYSRMERRTICGKGRNITPQQQILGSRVTLIRKANELKFQRNVRIRQRLMDTYPSEIVGPDDDPTPKILEEIRDNYVNDQKLSTDVGVERSTEPRSASVFSVSALSRCAYLVEKILNAALRQHSTGKFSDSIDTTLSKIVSAKAYSAYGEWRELNDQIFATQNFVNFARETREKVKLLPKKFDPRQTNIVTLKIAKFVLWCSQDINIPKAIEQRMKMQRL